jgi:DNA primase
VPILDRNGKNVIALGGRIVPQSGRAKRNFEPAKYINSPESPVFIKGSTLFNEGVVREQLSIGPRQGRTVPTRRFVILVEGYMDAISLWNAGVREVVASMGASLSMEQLRAAARLVQPVEGFVVLCLDNDDAGIAAVERICGNGVLKEVSEKYKVDIRVATMPEEIKDPDEYVQLRKGEGDVGQEFVESVIQRAADWNKWFIERILLSYNPEAQRERIGSFGDVFNRVAEHLATSMNSADRTRSAYNVADALARVLAKEKNATDVSDVVRNQLESDLIEECARIASVRDSVRRRTEAASLGKADANANRALRALSKGEGPSGIEERITAQTKPFDSSSPISLQDTKQASKLARSSMASMQVKAVKRARDAKPRAVRPRSAPTLTPHFAGFRFANKSDQDWLTHESPLKVQQTSLVTATIS